MRIIFYTTMFQDSDNFKKRTAYPRKLLWLIPFMLAKKLLTTGLDKRRKVFATARGMKVHTAQRCRWDVRLR